MGAYLCAICDNMFCHHEVNCFEYGNNQLICEGCHMELEIELEGQKKELINLIKDTIKWNSYGKTNHAMINDYEKLVDEILKKWKKR